MDEVAKLGDELVQVARLAAEHKDEDLRLFLARLARRYRRPMPELSAELGRILETATHEPARGADRRMDLGSRTAEDSLPMLRPVGVRVHLVPPVLADSVLAPLEQLVSEWRQADALAARGLRPVSSAIFTGPPGVGKTFTAQWLSNQLDLPLLSLDLTAVMSSRLGQSGANLRSVLDYARSAPSLLFLDEVDSIAKRRADDSDVGELKRLVTIMLQELDDWPSTSLLIAATNHAELIDPALWRRFDLRVEFPMPEEAEVAAAIERYLGDEIEQVRPFLPAMEKLLASSSFSDIERAMSRVRKHLVLGGGDAAASVEGLVKGTREALTRAERIAIATDLQRSSPMSQHQISRLMNVSRDTLRKHGRDQGGTSDG